MATVTAILAGLAGCSLGWLLAWSYHHKAGLAVVIPLVILLIAGVCVSVTLASFDEATFGTAAFVAGTLVTNIASAWLLRRAKTQPSKDNHDF